MVLLCQWQPCLPQTGSLSLSQWWATGAELEPRSTDSLGGVWLRSGASPQRANAGCLAQPPLSATVGSSAARWEGKGASGIHVCVRGDVGCTGEVLWLYPHVSGAYSTSKWAWYSPAVHRCRVINITS